MSQVLVNFRMDEEDKKGMEEVCKELGLSMTTAFTLLAKKMRREKRAMSTVGISCPERMMPESTEVVSFFLSSKLMLCIPVATAAARYASSSSSEMMIHC